MNQIKYIFFGTSEFAALILERLVWVGMAPVAVVTNPDRPVGREKIITPPCIALKAKSLKLQAHILQPEYLHVIRHELKSLHPDVGILAAYGKIIPQDIIAVFPKGIVVAHPSLLPTYRGATPIQTAILNGDAETGTTLFLMDEKIDHGPLLASRLQRIAYRDTYKTLMKKLAEASANLIVETLPRYLRGAIVPQTQDETRASYTKKFMSEDGFVPAASLRAAMSGEAISEAQRIWRMGRALNPEPGVWTTADDYLFSLLRSARIHGVTRVKLLETDVVYPDDSVGAGGKLVLKKIQFEGRKPQCI